jgi:helix-turn-helix protein
LALRGHYLLWQVRKDGRIWPGRAVVARMAHNHQVAVFESRPGNVEEGREVLLDLKDVAARLGVDYETARKYVACGKLRSVRLPSLVNDGPRRRIQVREEDLAEFIAGAVVATESGPIDVRSVAEIAVSKRTRKTKNGRPYAWTE